MRALGFPRASPCYTLRRCSTLEGMVDLASVEGSDQKAELFLDRDPKVFERLLRLMRPPLVFGGQLRDLRVDSRDSLAAPDIRNLLDHRKHLLDRFH